MSTVAEATAALTAALKAIDSTHRLMVQEPGATIQPPSLVVSALPSLTWEAYCVEPTSATYLVWLIVPLDERAPERLRTLLGPVVEALHSVPDASVTRADGMPYLANGSELPSYELTVQVAL